jgi:hypothetical protein
MKVRVQVIVESNHGETQCVEDVAQFERGALQPVAVGLTFAAAEALLQCIQRKPHSPHFVMVSKNTNGS